MLFFKKLLLFLVGCNTSSLKDMNKLYKYSFEIKKEVYNRCLEEKYAIVKFKFDSLFENDCSASKCKVNRVKKTLKEKDTFDLRGIQEGFSNCSNGRDKWNEIYKLVKNNRTMYNLISGLHLSISVHISFYRKRYNLFNLPFPKALNVNEEYLRNFMFVTLLTLRSLLIFEGKVKKEKSDFKGENIEVFNNILKIVETLDCEKCRIWGSTNVSGLMAVIKINTGNGISKNEEVCMYNLANRLLTSLHVLKLYENRTLVFILNVANLLSVHFFAILAILICFTFNIMRKKYVK